VPLSGTAAWTSVTLAEGAVQERRDWICLLYQKVVGKKQELKLYAMLSPSAANVSTPDFRWSIVLVELGERGCPTGTCTPEWSSRIHRPSAEDILPAGGIGAGAGGSSRCRERTRRSRPLRSAPSGRRLPPRPFFRRPPPRRRQGGLARVPDAVAVPILERGSPETVCACAGTATGAAARTGQQQAERRPYSPTVGKQQARRGT